MKTNFANKVCISKFVSICGFRHSEMNRINPNFLNHEFYGGKVGVGLVQIPDGIRSSETTKLFFLRIESSVSFFIIMQVSMPKIGIVFGLS